MAELTVKYTSTEVQGGGLIIFYIRQYSYWDGGSSTLC